MPYLYTRTATCCEAEDQPDQDSEGAEVAALPWQSDLMMMGFTVVIQPEQKSIIRAQNKTKNRKYSARSSPDLVACCLLLGSAGRPWFSVFSIRSISGPHIFFTQHCAVSLLHLWLLPAICYTQVPNAGSSHSPTDASSRHSFSPHAHCHTPINSRGNLAICHRSNPGSPPCRALLLPVPPDPIHSVMCSAVLRTARSRCETVSSYSNP